MKKNYLFKGVYFSVDLEKYYDPLEETRMPEEPGILENLVRAEVLDILHSRIQENIIAVSPIPYYDMRILVVEVVICIVMGHTISVKL